MASCSWVMLRVERRCWRLSRKLMVGPFDRIGACGPLGFRPSPVVYGFAWGRFPARSRFCSAACRHRPLYGCAGTGSTNRRAAFCPESRQPEGAFRLPSAGRRSVTADGAGRAPNRAGRAAIDGGGWDGPRCRAAARRHAVAAATSPPRPRRRDLAAVPRRRSSRTPR